MENCSILRMLLDISGELVKQEKNSNYVNKTTESYSEFIKSIFYISADSQSKTNIDEYIIKIRESINLFSSKIEYDIVFFNDFYKQSLKVPKTPTNIQKKAIDYIFKFWKQKDSYLGRYLVPVITLNPGAGKT